uniref:Isopenicillin N synthase-like Fe(2+) 2OG dioxygenase domain-containing protein n=1 Tax=Cucumis sativus TaxID=3659 RepID=A0A0A0L372_CUCSA
MAEEKKIDTLRETLEEYSAAVKDVTAAIFGGVEKALGIKEGELSELFKEGNQSMRMNYYPPCPEPEKVIGLTPHSDPVGLTILLQINEVEGLKIKKDGNSITVIPLPNAS